MFGKIVLFLIINFAALAIGGLFTGKGVPSEWYMELNKAPWTPPGWVFGAAWTTIMICFSLYLAFLWPSVDNKKLLIGLFAVQWILNVAWNPIFFQFHAIGFALIFITLLTFLIGYFLILYWTPLKLKSILLLPYLIWLLIATSLNGYIFLKN
ncbi:MAG: tryptophan-rich sensory protein [Crocinitomicaceae bacterium]|jgi:tryptophan-rich sensory protein|nr:tryptophan-rich sensory protein [Crocinitomicaceae bacterium]